MPLTFGYWNVRGRGAPIRNLLCYIKANYEEVLYPLDPPNYSKEKWLQEKHSLSLDFPNLPWLKDTNNDTNDVVKITQVTPLIA